VLITGQEEGQPQSDCMGVYSLMNAMNDNKPVFKMTNGRKFLYYSPFYENWNIGSKVGAQARLLIDTHLAA
jgi:hypothetical protein